MYLFHTCYPLIWAGLLVQIKAANKKFLTDVLAIKHTEELLLQAGWRPKVRGQGAVNAIRT